MIITTDLNKYTIKKLRYRERFWSATKIHHVCYRCTVWYWWFKTLSCEQCL